MAIRSAEAVWEGELKGGNGSIKVESGAFQGKYSFSSRFESGGGTNPEELIGAAHAACFSMAFAHTLTLGGFKPQQVHTTAKVHLEKEGDGFVIPKIDLVMQAKVPNIDRNKFQELAEQAKVNCPVSKVLAGAKITLDATLV